MAYFRNTLNQGINPTGTRRVPPGAVVQVSDDDAKLYSGLNGVEKASQSDYREFVESGTVTSDKTGGMVLDEVLAEKRAEARMVSVAAPLQVVVGDDEAPYGPPTGERSTKAQEAEKDLAHRLAFADHEALGTISTEDLKEETRYGVPNGILVHNEQAANKEAAEAVAQEIVDVLEDPSGDGAVEEAKGEQDQKVSPSPASS
jgi:hypothetical protein